VNTITWQLYSVDFCAHVLLRDILLIAVRSQIDKATLDKASAAVMGETATTTTTSSSSSSSDSDSGSAGDSTAPRKSVGDLSDAELKGKKVKP
jgi:hypothetical protein